MYLEGESRPGGILIKVGSLFDGIGGWLLAATHAGAIPTWSSEIDPFPSSVSHAHFPNAKQLGDITQVKGDEIEPVDIICAGSPCQDLSIAGQRAGLSGERSNLFYQALRIVREMQVKTNGAYPKFFIWENVTGAFSSNGRRDFQAVLEEIAETNIPIPGSGRWARAGMVRSKQCGISWRVLDAQFWGVPQHRERIFLIAGFGKWGGLTEVLFEPESVRRNNTTSEESGEATPAGTGRSADAASWGFGNGQVDSALKLKIEKVGALNAMHDPQMIVTPTIVEVRQPKVKGQGGGRSDDNGKQMHHSFHQ